MKTMYAFIAALVLSATLSALAQATPVLHNQQLAVGVSVRDGAYEILLQGLQSPVLISDVGAEVNRPK